MSDLAVSVVLHRTPFEEYGPLVDVLLASPRVAAVYLVDHSPRPLPELPSRDPRVVQVHDASNPGFGAGHNRALRQSLGRHRYHAVVNPDIVLDPELLGRLAAFLDGRPEVGAVMPTIRDPEGRVANQGRLLPDPWDLFGRRWLPALWRRRRRRYEVSLSPGEGPRNLPNLSGSFLVFRCEALEEVGLFDERFFLYCEDVDLVRRLHARYHTVVVPHLEAVHRHRRASYRSWRMTLVHCWSAIRYFTKWGWFHDPGRRLYNRRALNR